MDGKVIASEKERLLKTYKCLEHEMKEIDARLTRGISAADDDTAEAITRQYLKRLRALILIRDQPYFARVDLII